MNHSFKLTKKYLFILIFSLATFLLFFRFDRADIQNDDATYSFRAVQYLDFVDSIDSQTTPIVWFDSIPWWSRLSFHDAPPVVFIIQFIFFKLLGISVFTAKLPFVLASLGSLIIFYFLVKKLYNQNLALISASILSGLTYFTWAGRVGYLEPIALFFILLTIYAFVLALKNEKYFLFFGAILGLTLLTKYTAFFILPVIFSYLLWKRRDLFLSRYFFLSIIIAFLIFSPVIFYNFKLYQARGHFDLQFSLLFNQNISQDWPGISRGGVSLDLLEQTKTFFLVFKEITSWPMLILFLAAAIYFLAFAFRRESKNENLFISLIILFSVLVFILIGPSVRYVSLINPFIALVCGWVLLDFWSNFCINQEPLRMKKIIFLVFLGLIFTTELCYNINTNILLSPLGKQKLFYSGHRLEDLGFQQLNDYLLPPEKLSQFPVIKIKNKQDLMIDSAKDLPGKDVYIYDPTISWFATLWYFRQPAIYRHIAFISAAELEKMIPPDRWLGALQQMGIRDLYYIWGLNKPLPSDEREKTNQAYSAQIAQAFAQVSPEIKDIYNKNDKLSFKVYKLKLNN